MLSSDGRLSGTWQTAEDGGSFVASKLAHPVQVRVELGVRTRAGAKRLVNNGGEKLATELR